MRFFLLLASSFLFAIFFGVVVIMFGATFLAALKVAGWAFIALWLLIGGVFCFIASVIS